MADVLAGTAEYIVYCRGHGVVGFYAEVADANAAMDAHFQAQHVGFGRDQTSSDAVVADDAEIWVTQVNRVVPDDVSSSSSSSA